LTPGKAGHTPQATFLFMETLSYFVWTALLVFFAEGQDGRAQPLCKKKARALPNKKLSVSGIHLPSGS
jgi:hypothetical protein